MAAKDKYHDHVRRALEKDGWTITHDPYFLKLEGVTYPVDLGAEKMIAAQKENKKILVEVKSFIAESIPMNSILHSGNTLTMNSDWKKLSRIASSF